MNSLNQSIIEAEAHIHRSAFLSDWSTFSKSIIWFKIKKAYDYNEREQFRKCWESA